MSNIEGLDRLMKKLAALGGAAEDGIERGMQLVVNQIQQEARLLVPFDTGELRENIYKKVETETQKCIGTVGTNKWYAPYVEFGTGPKGEASKPVHAKGINYRQSGWTYHDGNNFVYTKGQAAKPFLYPALVSVKPKAKGIIAEGFNHEIKKLTH